jgi:ABC-type uncharacterized transport system involved in gliding motility auxiliary subunit
MKNNSTNVLFSTVGVAALFVTLVALNFLVSRAPVRVDLTAEKSFTLSEGTKAILSKLDTPVQVRLYCTRNEQMPPNMKLYAQQVEDLLAEYRQASKGLIEIKKLNPEPDSDAEDSAKLDGIEGQLLSTGETIYLGLSVTMLDSKEALPFLNPDRERLLEYDLSRAISRVTTPERAVIGLMSPLRLQGVPMNPMLMQMGQQGAPPWAIYSELARDFSVKEVPMTAESIPAEIKVLLLVHPKQISEKAQYAIDQFILRGGKLIAFLDPTAVLDQAAGPASFGRTSASSIDKLLNAWGLTFDTQKVVADMNYLGRTNRGRTPGVLALTDQAMSKDDVVTAASDNLFMIYGGAFTGTPAEGLKQTVLIKSSKNSQLVESMLAPLSPDDLIRHFIPSNQEYPLAIRLTGKFKTAFPNGKPADAAESDADTEAPKETLTPTELGLKESAAENSVILIGDSDMLADQVTVTSVQNPFGGRVQLPANGNLAFIQASVEQLTGDSNLISVRGRASRIREFTVVKAMQAEAEASYRTQISELESKLTETRLKLAELQRSRETGEAKPGQRFILSPEQQAELANFRKTEAEVKRSLKEVRRNLRTEIDALENRMKWLNIAVMPLAVTATGVGLAILKRKRATAK